MYDPKLRPANNLNAFFTQTLDQIKPGKPPIQPDPEAQFDDKLATFQSDVEDTLKMKGRSTHIPFHEQDPTVSYFKNIDVGPSPGTADIAPKDSADVDVPGVASLKQTGMTTALTLARLRGPDYESYFYDKAKGTVEAVESEGGGWGEPGKLQTFTLDLNAHTVLNYHEQEGRNLPRPIAGPDQQDPLNPSPPAKS